MLKPLRKFGQNFLVDQNISKKIVNTFAPLENDLIVEIGPGQGALTSLLLLANPDLYAVEIDSRAAAELAIKFPGLKLIESDILKLDFSVFNTDKKIRVIGNIPYNITSSILFLINDNKTRISDALLMMQLEVANRLYAKPSSKEYGILTVLLGAFWNFELCFKVPPTVFIPRPKVQSAVVKLTSKDNPLIVTNYLIFSQFVKSCFNRRRKTIKNALSGTRFENLRFNEYDYILSKRAEQLSISEFINISNFIASTNEL